MTPSKIVRLLILLTTASFCQQADSGGIGYLGSGYGFPNDMRRDPIALGKVINFYFTGVPYILLDRTGLGGEWPEELGGVALEFDTGERAVRGRIGQVQFYNICRTRDVELSRTPTCLVTTITAQVPYDLTPGSSLNSIDPEPTYLTLITPGGRSIPRSVAVSYADMRLLPPGAFGRGMEDFYNQPYVVYPRGPDLEPGDPIILYAYGLGIPERPVALGKAAGEPVPVPKRLIVNFHFTPGLPVLRVGPDNSEPYWTLPEQVEAEPDYVGLVPDKVGVYEIRLTVPDPPRGVNLPPCDDRSPNLTVTIAGARRSVRLSPDGVPIIGGIYRTPEVTDGFRACVKPRSGGK